MTANTNGHRAKILERFADDTGLRLNRITQRGRDPEDATFTLQFANGQTVRIGGINVLWSQAKLGQVLAVTAGLVPAVVATRDWRTTITNLVAYVIEVDEHPDETFQATVADWLQQYATTATHDHETAPALREPFIKHHGDAPHLHIHAQTFLDHIRRAHGEKPRLAEIRTALTDLRFEPIKITYNARGNGKDRQRSSTSYYRAPLQTLHLE